MTRHRGGNGFWVVQELSYGRRIFALSSRTGEVIAFKRSGWAISIDFKYSKESRSLVHLPICPLPIYPGSRFFQPRSRIWRTVLVGFFIATEVQPQSWFSSFFTQYYRRWQLLCVQKKKGPLDFYYSHSSSAVHYLLVAMWWLLLSQLNSLVYIYCSLHTSQMLMFWACWCDLFLQYINSP